jgi:signal transduction histidine kinase/serine phosphatase RsbU (regulator of sigma subunit)/CheY-like chemotaxis protein
MGKGHRIVIVGERSDMRALSREFDWSATPVGPADRWPQSLRTAMSMVLDCGFPMILWWGPEMVQVYNDAYVEILQGKHPRALGQGGRECWAEIWDAIAPLFAEVAEHGVSIFKEDLLLPLNRKGYPEECYFTFSYSPIRDERGGVGGILCTVNETTTKVLSERRLRTLRDLEARAFEAKTVSEACELAAATLGANPADLPLVRIFSVNQDGRYAAAGTSGAELGPAAEAALAVGVEAMLRAGDVSSTIELPSAAEPVRYALAQAVGAVEQGRGREVLVTGLSPSLPHEGEYRSFLTVVAGQLAGALKNARAAQTERERLERLAELDEAKTAFFSNVSHEFRTPLTLMLGPLEELESSGEVASAQGREQLDSVRRNALRLLKLVNTLLEFSRIEAGRLEGSFRPTDLAEATTDLASTFRSAIEAAGLRLEVDARPLPERVYVDRAMWERIVLNLLSNALKFTFSGEIRISIGPSADGQAAELRVADTGTGIPPEALPRLFERFRRVRGAKARTHEGTGIGLALVHDLAELHGGSVSVESELERGTTFTVRVPLGSVHLPADQIDHDEGQPSAGRIAAQYLQEARDWSRENEPAGARGRTGRPMVLVADDNADLRAYIARLFADRYDVETVADGAAALDAIARGLPDLIVTDAMMPVMDGFELLRRLRADERAARVPVIMLSARAGQESAVEGLEAGADDYLVKPFSADELRARAEAHLKVAKLRESEGDGTRERELSFLMEATRVLGSSLDLAATLAHVFEIALPTLGDACTVRLVDERGRLVGVDVAHVDPRKRELSLELYRAEEGSDPNPGGALDTVLRSGVSALFPEVSPEIIEAQSRDARHLALQRAIGMRSVMLVPLTARGRVLGTIGFSVTESDRRYDEGDLAVAEEFARRVAAAVDNAQLFERERRVAQRFQEAALPTSLPSVPGLSFSSYYTPGQSEALIGGDWYDALRLPDGRVVISIGDVAGSGLEAAVTMGNVRQVIRGVAHIHPDPALILDAADKTLRAEHPDRLVTAFIAVLDQVGGMLSYASAGHPAPLLRAADGTLSALDVVGLPLGLRERDEPGAVNAELERGSLLLLYTDGLVEATHDYLEGESRLRAALADPQVAGADGVARAVYERVLPGGARDDVALLAVRVASELVADPSGTLPQGFVRSWSFDARDAIAAHRARHEFAAEIVARAGSDADAMASELVFGELVGNVVRHADGTVNVILDWTASAPVLHVIDDGPGFQHNPKLPADLLAESGRGLFLVTALTFDFQVTKRVGRGSHARTVLAVRPKARGQARA